MLRERLCFAPPPPFFRGKGIFFLNPSSSYCFSYEDHILGLPYPPPPSHPKLGVFLSSLFHVLPFVKNRAPSSWIFVSHHITLCLRLGRVPQTPSVYSLPFYPLSRVFPYVSSNFSVRRSVFFTSSRIHLSVPPPKGLTPPVPPGLR